jgi:tRNA(Arg) A34 adenosine deaminase TadA
MARHDDEMLLRRAFEVARRSRANGDHPFGALLAGPARCCASRRTAIPPKAET